MKLSTYLSPLSEFYSTTITTEQRTCAAALLDRYCCVAHAFSTLRTPDENGLKPLFRSEYSYNHVDRVRLGKSSNYNRDCPNRGSGWRQRSASHSDLIAPSKSSSSSQNRHLRTSRSLDWNNNVDFQEFCSRVEPEKDYDDYYYENYENKNQRYDSYQQPANESCSLRRTRSLAVIREETFNDLQISSINTRRSQLIPRAKLVNRSFFRQRYHQKHRRDEDSTGSGLETQTSETRESDDYYVNLKRLDSVKIVPPSWQNDKSDLESLNSDYFKNSAHQGNQHDKQKQRQYQQQKISKNSRSGSRFQVLEIEVHQDNSQSSAFPETTPSNTDHSDSSSSADRDREDGLLKEVVNSEKFEEIHLKEVVQVSEEQISSRTLTLKKDKNKDEDIQRPFIAYDSVYLSSEDSSVEGTIIEENFEEKFENVIISSNHDSENTSLLQISIEDDYDQHVDINEEEYKECERIYTQVNKPETIPSSKPKILSVERKLKTLSDYATTTKRGVLEHLTYISTSQILKTNDVHVIDSFRPNLIENQYYSLPDINIGRSLKLSERIDAKLRSTYNVSHVEETSGDASRGSSSDQSAIYNSINRFGRAHKRARQREFGEIDSLIKDDVPISDEAKSIELEQPKEAPSIEVEPEAICKEDADVNESKLSLKDFYVEDIKAEGEVITSSDPITIEADSVEEDGQRTTPFEQQEANNSEARFQINQTTNNFPGQFRIIVTDAQNNVIEEDSIESTASTEDDIQVEVKSSSCTPPTSFKRDDEKDTVRSVVTDTWKDKNKDIPDSESLNVINSTKEREQINKIRPPSPIPLPKNNINNEKEILDKANIFRARPVKIYSNDVLRISETKMSRPQILHVIDSKKCDTPRQDNDKKTQPSQVEEEFLNRVDSVRCYWSKLIQDEKDSGTTEKDERNFVTSIEDEKCVPNSQIHLPLLETAGQINNNNNNNLQSFTPTVEIVELDGEKQATIVKAHDVEEPEFDHVRYKIMKSNLFRKNILTRNTKEAQFDGLLQYLQDYSFQELLSNNNVVIIEPVRTKIEKPSQGQAKTHTNNCKITGGSGADVKSSNTKRHFFYHPVRVNRELLEDELPSPDTVRNVRRFFEENVLRKQSNGGLSKPQKSTESPSASSHKRRNLRYLTIDTSYGGLRKWDSASLSSGISSGDLSSPCDCSNEGEPQNQGRCPSKAENGQHEEIYTSEENLCDDDICESYYVSEDVLEKIRECGSTVTYYGGQVVNNKSPELNPVTKAIIQEIRDEETRKCTACQPNSCPQDEDLQHQIMDKGLKFKLVKSNSCSSRLELVGTEKDSDNKTLSQGKFSNMSTTDTPEPEETVRELVHRLESGAISSNPVPRIIESQCIEKTNRSGSLTSSYEGSKSKFQESVTINNHLIGSKDPTGLVDIIKQVTVNNHISFCPPLSNVKTSTTERISSSGANADVSRDDEGQLSPTAAIISQKTNKKLCRNKNVDLAFTMTKSGSGTIKSLTSEKLDCSSSSSSTSSSKHSSLSLDTDKLLTKNKSQGDDFGILRKNSGPFTETAVKGAAADTVSNPSNVKTDGRRDDNILYNGSDEHRINSNKIENGISDAEIGQSKLTTIFHSENNEKRRNLSAIEKHSPRENCDGPPRSEEKRKMNLQPSLKQEGPPPPTPPQADKSFVKHYVANDRKLVEIRKYDDIEFEEFEVYDPASGTKETRNDPASDAKETAARNENPEECYDSLDDKL